MPSTHVSFRSKVRQLLIRCLSLIAVPHLFRWLHRDQVAVLMYHGVMPDEVTAAEGDCLQVRASNFRQQMEYLKQHYEVCSLHEAHSRLGQPGAKPRAVVTFDDGYANNYLTAFPILKELGIPATIFLVTGKIGTDKVFWWDRLHLATRGTVPVGVEFTETLKRVRPQAVEDQADGYLRRLGLAVDHAETKYYQVLDRDQISAMAASGLVEFGCHNHDHEPLNTLHWQEIEATLKQSTAYLEALVGPVRYFAAPYGEYDNYTFPSLRLFHFELALSTEEGFLSTTSDRFRIPRLGIERDASLDEFACLTSGFMPWLHRCKALLGLRLRRAVVDHASHATESKQS